MTDQRSWHDAWVDGILGPDEIREPRTLREALEGDRTGAQQTPRRGTGSWVRLPGKMSKTRFDAPRSVPPILPLEGWLWVSLVMQVVLLACVVWMEFRR